MKLRPLLLWACLIPGLLASTGAVAQPRDWDRVGNGRADGRVTLDEAVRRARGRDRQVMSARTVERGGRRVHVIRTLTPDGRVRRFQMDAYPDRLDRHDR